MYFNMLTDSVHKMAEVVYNKVLASIQPEHIHQSIMIGAFLGTALFYMSYRLHSWCLKYKKALMDRKLSDYRAEVALKLEKQSKPTKIDLFTVDKTNENCVDLASVNYLNMLNSDLIKNNAIECIKKYGVGTCGPRGFSGTTQAHKELEKQLIEFLGVEDLLIYPYGFAASSNAFLAHCKSNDMLFCDEKINFALEQGVLATKAMFVYFKHNNPSDLRQKLAHANKDNSLTRTIRKFILIEGIYSTTGVICHLPEFVALAKEFQVKIFLDESISIGILGLKGRGVTEHYHVNVKDITLIIGSMEGALGSIGSFCAGSKAMIEHQRLSSCGYVFSSPLATFQAHAAITALVMIENSPDELRDLQLLSRKVHKFLGTSPYFDVLSSPMSPCKVFTLKNKGKRRQWEREICEYCQANGVFLLTNENGLVMHLNVSLYYLENRLSNVYKILELAAESIKP